MSASAILSIAAVAAPSIGSAGPIAPGAFEAVLTVEMAGAKSPLASIPVISTAPADNSEPEPSTEDGPPLDAAAEKPSDLSMSPVWFQMAAITLPTVNPTAIKTIQTEATPALPSVPTPAVEAVDDVTTDLVALAVPQTSVAKFKDGPSAPEPVQSQTAIANPEVTIEARLAGSSVDPLNSALADAAAMSAQPTQPTDHKLVAKPSAVEIGSASSVDPASLRLKPIDAPDTPLSISVPQPPRPAEPSALANAALDSLRQMPGAQALQQATISRREFAASVATKPVPVGPVIIPSTAPDAAVEAVGSTPLPSSMPLAGEPVRNAASARSPSIDATTVVVDAAEPSPPVKADIAAATPAASSDGTIDVATAVRPVDLLSQDVAPIDGTPPESTAQGVASTPTASSTASLAAQGGLLFSGLSRATVETTANLAAQITSRLVGRSTRLELGLTPEGLGRVDVTLDIDDDGQLSARLAFDNPLAATELRGRADELRRQLEDAGFTLARDALDFSSRDNPSGGERRQQRASAYADRHAANDDMIDIASTAWMPSPNRLTPQGVDVKV